MAKRTITQLEDDLDGGEADETVTFGLDGRTYEVDLSESNATSLRKALAPYIGGARRGGRTARHVSVRRPSSAVSTDTAAVRAWAIEEGYEVSSRGRISAEIRAAYESS